MALPANIAAIVRIIKPNELARRFSFVLSEWLEASELAEINRLNATEEYSDGCCATHNFCDANQAMLDALEHFGIDGYWNEDELNSLINTAWNIARADKFHVTMTENQ